MPSEITCEFVSIYPFESTIIPVPTPVDSVGIENILSLLIVVVVIPTTEGFAFSLTAWYTFVLLSLLTTILELVPWLVLVVPFSIPVLFTITTVNSELKTEHIIATITIKLILFFFDIIYPPIFIRFT